MASGFKKGLKPAQELDIEGKNTKGKGQEKQRGAAAGTMVQCDYLGLPTSSRLLTGYTCQHACMGGERMLRLEPAFTVLCSSGAW